MNYVYGFDYGLLKYSMPSYKKNISPFSKDAKELLAKCIDE